MWLGGLYCTPFNDRKERTIANDRLANEVNRDTVPRVKYLIPILVLVSVAWSKPKDPVYWSYPGPHGDDIRAALATERTDDHQHHLILPDELDAYLAGIPMPENFGCLADTAICTSEAQGLLVVLGFGARVDASAKRTGKDYEVTLVMTLADGAKPKTFLGRGQTIEVAVRSAFVALNGQGSLLLALTPKDASFRIDDRPHGQGNGEYLVGAGTHKITVEAPKYRPFERSIVVKAAERIKLTIKLAPDFGKLSLQTKPKGAKVYLDGTLWANPKTFKDVDPGEHIIRVEAPGYHSFTQSFKIKPAVEHALNLTLRSEEPHWRRAMRTIHSHTHENPWYVGLNVQAISARNGPIELETDGPQDLDSLIDSAGLFGFGINLGWRSRYLEVLGLGISYQAGGSDAKVKLEQSAKSRLDSLNRVMIRTGWVGLRLPIWRVDAYGLAGVGLAMESFTVKTASETYKADTMHLFVGTEIGVRYSVNAHWFAGSGVKLDYWPGNRASAAWILNGGFAFDTKGLF